MKRLLLILLLLIAGAVAWGWMRMQKPAVPLEPGSSVRIHQGIVVGGIDPDNAEIQVFNGIPYASAARWSAPYAPPQWGATPRDAREFGPECIQPRSGANEFVGDIVEGIGLSWWKERAAKAYMAAQSHEANESEACLFLNVRTANLDGDAMQPVMVWIHGGSHVSGSGSQSIYQTNGLVEHGVVLVTINYRLGPLGYLAHPALSEADGTSGNYGLMDQITALAWVRDNIAAFGGDPSNVTIFGESAGAQSVTEIMASPRAATLFHKAILQSGASSYNALNLKTSTLPGIRSAEDVGREFLSGLAPDGADAQTLRKIPVEDILARYEERLDLSGYFLPVVDGAVLPRMIGAAIRDGDIPAVPILAGYNADEASLFYADMQTPTVLSGPMTGSLTARQTALAGVFGDNNAKALQALYGMDEADGWEAGAEAMLGDDMFGVHMRFLGARNAEAGAPTWLYHFTRTWPSKKQTIGAHHAAEIAFVFDGHSPLVEPTSSDRALTDAMTAYWTNFAKTGDPNGTGLPAWPAYSPETDTWLLLGETIKPESNLRARKLDILESKVRSRIASVAGTPKPAQVEDVTIASSGEERSADSN